MQFLKSLFCLQGYDNRQRYLAICSAVFTLFILLSSAFTSHFFLAIITSLLCTATLGLSTLRRLHDANLKEKWVLAPSLLFLLISSIIILTNQPSSYYLLIIPVICTCVLLTYSSHIKRHFILGYYGPVNLTEYQHHIYQNKQVQNRIEPTWVNRNKQPIEPAETYDKSIAAFMHTNEVANDIHSPIRSSDNQTDIGEWTRLNVLLNIKAQLFFAAIIGLTLIGFATSWLMHYFSSSDDVNETNQQSEQHINTSSFLPRNFPLAMPDNYVLYLSNNRGVIINWQADVVKNTDLWSQATGQGDGTCQDITFNQGTAIRTLSVQVEQYDGAKTDYFANFSPLDSQALIQALAFNSNFSLCGYNFSLKGSQAALGGNNHFSQWLN